MEIRKDRLGSYKKFLIVSTAICAFCAWVVFGVNHCDCKQVFSLLMWDSPFLVNKIGHSILSLYFFKFWNKLCLDSTLKQVSEWSLSMCTRNVANSLRSLDPKHCHFLRLCLRFCFPYAWLLYATWSHDIVRKGRKIKSRIRFLHRSQLLLMLELLRRRERNCQETSPILGPIHFRGVATAAA